MVAGPAPVLPWAFSNDVPELTVLSYEVQSLVYEQDARPGIADVTLFAYSPEYGQKLLTPPPPPEQLFYPTTWGPNYEGELEGALLTPAIVPGVQDEDGTVRDIPAAGSRLNLTPGQDLASTVALGILPFKDGS